MKHDNRAQDGSIRRLVGVGEPVSAQRERILNLPRVVTGVIVALALVQLALESLPSDIAIEIFGSLALIPARFTYFFAPDAVVRALQALLTNGANPSAIASALNRAGWAWWTPLTYAFLHGDWTHLTINCVSLSAFGSPVARRLGPNRFLALLAVCAIAGALMHLLFHPFEITPVVGASAAISGTMAAVARFAFTPGAPLAERGASRPGNGSTSLRQFASNRRAVFFIVAWFGVNFLFGRFPRAAGASGLIAWEAHLGGFLAGLLLFDFFDRYRKSGGS
jgi:membrane associated rhomboid family serine protease